MARTTRHHEGALDHTKVVADGAHRARENRVPYLSLPCPPLIGRRPITSQPHPTFSCFQRTSLTPP